MEVITTPSAIRHAISDLLSDRSDERIVVVAFVGADALSFVPVAKGLSVYCWPKAGATNPAGIDALLDAGANVGFVERLHAKIYWSKSRGSLIGSANLTANALGDTGLQEAVVRLPPSAFDVRPLVQSLAIASDFEAALKRLRVAHLQFLQKNPHLSPRPARLGPVDSFKEWCSRAGRAEWRIGWYEDEDVEPPSEGAEISASLGVGHRGYGWPESVRAPRFAAEPTFHRPAGSGISEGRSSKEARRLTRVAPDGR